MMIFFNMTKFFYFLLPCLLLAAPPKIEKKIQGLFKSDTHIKNMDAQLNNLYTTVKALASDKQNLIDEQKKWIELRNEHIENKDKVQKLYEDRLVELKKNCELTDFFKLFLNGNKTIDSKNSVLLEKLEKCQFEICKIYKLFFDYQNSDDKKAIEEKTMAELSKFSQDSSIDQNCTEIKTVESVMARILLERVYRNDEVPYEFNGIPFWLFDKNRKLYFDVTDSIVRGIICIISNVKFDEEKQLQSVVDEILGDCFFGTSYASRHRVTMYIDMDAYKHNSFQEILFAPERCTLHKKSLDEYQESLVVWSLNGIYNQLTYKRFLKEFEKAVENLKRLYKDTGQKQEYINKAELYLASHCEVGFDLEFEKIYNIIKNAKNNLAKIKEMTKNFTKEDKNVLLHAFILADFNEETIDWLMSDKDIDINHKYKDETYLMNAVMRPSVMKKLIAKNADLEATNFFGKTALFYAVQFSDLESVKILIEKKANINAKIDSLNEIKNKFYKEWGIKEETKEDDMMQSLSHLLPKIAYAPEEVCDFTPLVYAKRYAQKDVIDYLTKEGANQGSADQKRIDDWVNARQKR